MNTITSWVYIISTITQASWRRKKSGLNGMYIFIIRLLECLFLIPITFLIVGIKNTYYILLIYAWFRRLDDVLDHDSNPPCQWSRNQYLRHKVDLIETINRNNIKQVNSCLTEDYLLIKAISNNLQRNIDIKQDLLDEIECISLDYSRRDRHFLLTKKELYSEAQKQDKAVFSIFIKVLQSDIETFNQECSILQGIFTRIDWFSDMTEDIKNKIINIPFEILHDNNISKNISEHPEFKKWFDSNVTEIQNEWKEKKDSIEQLLGKVLSNYTLAPLLISFFIKKIDTVVSSL